MKSNEFLTGHDLKKFSITYGTKGYRNTRDVYANNKEEAEEWVRKNLGRVIDSTELTETLKQVNGKWALVSKTDPKKVLQYYKGSGKPSDDWVSKVEQRVHAFEENNQKPDQSGSKGYVFNIEQETINNTDYRRVMFTSKNNQIVLMSIPPGEEIGEEIHKGAQFIRVDKGMGKTILDGEETDLTDGMVVDVPAGVKHNIINTSDSADLKIYTVYSPPQHEEGLVQKTKPAPDEDDV